MVDPEEFREHLLDVLPKSVHKHIDVIINWVGDNDYAPTRIEVVNGHIAVDEIAVGPWTIGVDANGSPEYVDFGDSIVEIVNI